MMQIRRGNPVQITWMLDFKNEENTGVLQDSQKRLYLVDTLKNRYEITDFSVNQNVITFTWWGSHQNQAKNGKYNLLLLLDYGTHNQKIIDKTGVFILVEPLDGKTSAGQSTDVSIETINIMSEVGIGNVAVDLSRYYTKSEIDEMFADIDAQRAEDIAAQNEKLGYFNHTLGRGLITQNQSETAIGQFNISVLDKGGWGGNNTLFSIGNGSSDNFRKNAMEVKQNGDIYFNLEGETIRIQDVIKVEDEDGIKKIKFVGEATESDTTGLVSHDELSGMDLAQKQWVTKQIIDYITAGEVDMSLFVSKNELNAYGFAYHTEIVDLSYCLSTSYVTKDTLNSYVSKEELDSMSYVTHDEISYYITTTYLDDLNYVNTDDLAAQGYITARDLPDLSPYVKPSYITTYYYNKEQVNSLVLEQIQTNFVEKDLLFKGSAAYTISTDDIDRWNTPVNLTSYATKEYVNSKIESIPSADMSPYVTHGQLSRAGYITEHQDLSAYAKITYVNTKIAQIQMPDLSSYATKAYVNEKINAIPAQDLSQYATKETLNSYVTKTYLDTKLNDFVADESDPVFTASPAYYVTNDNLAVIGKIQYSNAFKKLEFNSESDSNDGFLATENYVLDQISQNSNIVVKLTRDQFDFLQSQNLVDEHKIYMITDEDDEVVHNGELSYYATKTYVGSELANYYTKAEIQNLLVNIGSGGTIDLTGYATHNWVELYIAGLNLANKVYVQGQVADALTEAKNYADTIETQGVDLTQYATKSYLNSKLGYYATLNDIPDTTGLATRTWVNSNFATKGDLQDIDYNNIDLSNYVSKSLLNSLGYITQHQDLTGYATESYVLDKVAAASGTDLSDYVSKTELDSMGYITQHQDLTDYATKSYVMNRIAAIDYNEQDLTDYVTKTYLNTRISELDIPERVDLTPYATKSYVMNKIESIEYSSPDLSNYATKTYVTNKINSIELPNMDNYATKTYVNAQISAATVNPGNIIWTGTQEQYDALQDQTTYQIYLIKQ